MQGKQKLSGQIGAGTLIRIKDGTMILKPNFRDYLLQLADKHRSHINIIFHQVVPMVERSIKRISVYQLQL